ncbi:acyltransferase family protein [Shewanella sedimentimangrovi]|uniref:Acyltransferase n=1 Tax=Shewanella sedimentimangrovi TaxID=2814293 RepID=A0ABX7QWY7_9GAMM|nr:acyltransferase [Shewanella sedimentimangrovi]
MINRENSNNFDLTRNVLSFLVFFTHWNILTNGGYDFFLFHLSGLAIDLFFIVSGFLIWWSYKSDNNIINFYLKRFFRIFPLYFFLILLQTLFFAFYSNGSIYDLHKYFLSNILFLNFISPTVGDLLSGLEVNAINGSLWTLKNEVIFYVLVPLLFKLYEKYGLKFLCLIYSFSILYIIYFHLLNNERMLFQFPAQIRLFLSGILAYIYFDRIGRFSQYKVVTLSLILVILFRENVYFRFTVYPLFLSVILIYFVYYVKTYVIKFDFSYSFYIIHFPLIQLAILFDLNPSNPFLSLVLLFSLTVLLSYLSELYIEKRFVIVGREIIKRRKNADLLRLKSR